MAAQLETRLSHILTGKPVERHQPGNPGRPAGSSAGAACLCQPWMHLRVILVADMSSAEAMEVRYKESLAAWRIKSRLSTPLPQPRIFTTQCSCIQIALNISANPNTRSFPSQSTADFSVAACASRQRCINQDPFSLLKSNVLGEELLLIT